MMRRSFTAVPITCLLVLSMGQAVLAQDEQVGVVSADYERVEVPEAGIAISFPSDWHVEVLMDEQERLAGPNPYATPLPVRYWSVLAARADEGGRCDIGMYLDHPAPIDGHAENIRLGYVVAENDGTKQSSVELAIGAAIRIDTHDPSSGAYITTYLFESGAARYLLTCSDEIPDPDGWLSAAKTVELVGAELAPSAAPATQPGSVAAREVLSLDAVSGFSSIVEVADGLLMSADCELAIYLQFDDGTFGEWLVCTLSHDPIDPPELQGTWPSDLVTVSGGACGWKSDYWEVTDGREVWASSYELTVTPDGRVFGWSEYAAQLLDCATD